jgi:hypothetical protein
MPPRAEKEGKQTSNQAVFATPTTTKGIFTPRTIKYAAIFNQVAVGPPAWSVPAKRAHPTSPLNVPKRGRIADPSRTPTKQIHFFSSPRCAPSPHHKPRASSPLRKPAVSPQFIIHRPQKRVPLGQLTVTLQSPGNGRVTSRDFDFYEDASPFKERGTRTEQTTPTKSNNKENVAPLRKQAGTEEDIFVRSAPRGGPLTKLKRSDRSEEGISSVTVETVVTEEVITEGYFAGAKIVEEKKRTVSRRKTGRVNSHRDHTASNYGEEAQLFEIFQDEVDMTEIVNEEQTEDSDEEDDKENADPSPGSRRHQRNDIRTIRDTRKTSVK